MRPLRFLLALALVIVALPTRETTSAALPAPAPESHLGLAADVLGQAHEALDLIFDAQSEKAIPIARSLQQRLPDHPIGYLLEVEADWWALYCQACSIRYNLIDAWSHEKEKRDDAYFALANRAIQIAEGKLAQQETAPMHVFAGMGYGLKARLHGLRGDHLAVARTGVRGREHFLRALALDPQVGDALTGIGLYNYLADALSGFAKMLRWFMGIPGGSKKEGIRQLEAAINSAELTSAEARFYLARNLRNFDEQYERGAQLMEPLVAEYPDNPVFQLLLGDVYAKLNRREPAALHFRAAQQLHVSDAACAAQVQKLAADSLAVIGR